MGPHMDPGATWTLDWDDGLKFTLLIPVMSVCGASSFGTQTRFIFRQAHSKPAGGVNQTDAGGPEWTVKIYADNLANPSKRPYSLKGQEATVEFGSSSLGDTLAFMGQLHTMISTHGLTQLWVKCHKPWLFDTGGIQRPWGFTSFHGKCPQRARDSQLGSITLWKSHGKDTSTNMIGVKYLLEKSPLIA